MARLHFWHRTVGICSALFVVLLVSTGLLLNHSSSLGLDRYPVGNGLLLDLYHIGAGVEPVSVRVGAHWISQLGRRAYLDDSFAMELDGPLIGAVTDGDTLVVASTDRLTVLTPGGRVIEVLGAAEGVPTAMQAIGKDAHGHILIRTPQGGYRGDLETLDWRRWPSSAGQWSGPTTTPGSLLEPLLQDYRGHGLSLERVLLDIHSGRILGDWGVYLIDAVALVFLLLAISGIWMWARRRW